MKCEYWCELFGGTGVSGNPRGKGLRSVWGRHPHRLLGEVLWSLCILMSAHPLNNRRFVRNMLRTITQSYSSSSQMGSHPALEITLKEKKTI